MPDPDRASLPYQIAGQEIAGQAGNDEKGSRNDEKTAGNDDMVPCTSFSSVIPDPLSSSCPTRSGIHQRQLPKTIEYFVTFTILARFANELKQNVLWQNQ